MCRKKRRQEIEEVEETDSENGGSLSFQELEALNNELYRVCGEMHENKDFINDPALKKVMWEEITNAYIAKSNEIKESKIIPQAIQRWTSYEKRKLLMPDLELARWFPLRKYVPNAIAKQCIEQARIEASIEFDARAAEIERQKEFVNDEPDEATEFVYLIADEFVPALKRKRFIKRNRGYLIWLLTASEYPSDALFDLIVDELTSDKTRENFVKHKGGYLKGLLTEFIENREAVAEEPAEAAAPVEEAGDADERHGETSQEQQDDEQDTLDALLELQDEGQTDAEPEAYREESAEAPEQQLPTETVTEDENTEVLTWVPQSVSDGEEEND